MTSDRLLQPPLSDPDPRRSESLTADPLLRVGPEGRALEFNSIAEIVDLDRYPLEDIGGASIDALIREGQAALKRDALFSLPGFVRPDAAAFMAGEIEGRVGMSARYEADRTSYNSDGNIWPAGHARAVTHRSRYNQVLNYQIPNNSPLRRLYCWEPLREFMRRVLGYASFHRSECPHLALSSKIAGDGDTDGWHFDGNDVVFSILLKEPEAGGLFEYVPYIRSATEENYDDVAAVFRGDRTQVRCPTLSVGDLNIFQGDYTLHRVTPVKGARNRVVGLLCYDRAPGTNFGEPYIEELRLQLPRAPA
jgi:hypothetical protein